MSGEQDILINNKKFQSESTMTALKTELESDKPSDLLTSVIILPKT